MFSFKRFLHLFIARNYEFYRDKAAFGWNFLFPFFIIAGFSVMFARGGAPDYKIGLVEPVSESTRAVLDEQEIFAPILYSDGETAMEALRTHKLDLLIDGPLQDGTPVLYFINEDSPKGKAAEAFLTRALLAPDTLDKLLAAETVKGVRIDYIDWLFPGVLCMNMMFSGLFGVGWVVVRYRKNGVLKRLKVTPLTALEYLSAQVVSRLCVLLFTAVVLYVGCTALFGFECRGSYLDLALVFLLGSASIVSLGLLSAARGASEEFTSGLINFISWPMMFVSEVWFSLEGAPEWVRAAQHIFPLTHLTRSMRAIMNDGASIMDLGYETLVMAAMALMFLSLGAYLFRWTSE